MAGAGRNLVHSPESGDQPPDRGSRLYQGLTWSKALWLQRGWHSARSIDTWDPMLLAAETHGHTLASPGPHGAGLHA